MFLAHFCRLFAVLAIAVLTAACSTGSDQGSARRFAGPDDAPAARIKPLDAAPVRSTRNNLRPSYNEPPARIATNCSNEPLAARPGSGEVIVGHGENLCRIAKRYQTTVQAIVDENRLSSPMLAVGMRLRLPSERYYATSPFGQLRRR